MLKITVEQHAQSTMLKLEGRLVGSWVKEVERVCQTETSRATYIQADLSGVTFIDAQGKRLLAEMYGAGLELIAGTLESRAIVENIEQSHRSRRGQRTGNRKKGTK